MKNEIEMIFKEIYSLELYKRNIILILMKLYIY